MSGLVDAIGMALEREVAMLRRMTITPLTIPVPEKVQKLARDEAQNIAYTQEEDSIGRYVRRKDAIPVFRSSAAVRRVLRIEAIIHEEAHIALIGHAMRHEGYLLHRKPLTFHDVAVYAVDFMPEGHADGWRVINPMEQ